MMFIDRDFIEDSESSDSFEGEEGQQDQFENPNKKFQPAELDHDFEPEHSADYFQPQQHQQAKDVYRPPAQPVQSYRPAEPVRDYYSPPAPQSYQPDPPRSYYQPEPARDYYQPPTPPRVQTPPRTSYEVKPLKKAENEKVGFMRAEDPEPKPTTASARPGSSSAAMRQRMLEQQRNQYLNKKETMQVTSSGTSSLMARMAEAEPQSTVKEFRSRNQPFASHIYEPSGGFKPEPSLAPVKAEKTHFQIQEIEEVLLDESKATKHSASKTVQSMQKPPEPIQEPPLTPRQELKPTVITEEPPPAVQPKLQPVQAQAPVELPPPPKPAPVEPAPQVTRAPPEEDKRPPSHRPEQQADPDPPRPVARRPVVNVQQILAEAMHDMHSFVTRPLPRDVNLQCTIRRERGGFNRLYPKYFLFTSDTRAFLLAGKKRPGNKTSNYLISMNEKELKTKSPAYLGKVRSNFMGTEFMIYDKGLNPKKRQATMETFREELGVVMYQSNLLGAKGPRKMRVLLPAVNAEGERFRWKPSNVSDRQKDAGMSSKFKGGDLTGMFDFFNKPPKWNEREGYADVQAFVLNFNGRVDKASVKNFQLIDNEDENRIYLQFGRVGDNEFTLDYQWPFSPMQAFAVALSSFDNKLACE